MLVVWLFHIEQVTLLLQCVAAARVLARVSVVAFRRALVPRDLQLVSRRAVSHSMPATERPSRAIVVHVLGAVALARSAVGMTRCVVASD